ncbi:hypothetical protein ARSEF4850_008827 [Beauveria asiatica]
MWAAGSMAKDMFDCLIDDIEPASAQSWPAVILETLQKLRNDDSLKNSPEYSNFVDSLDDLSRPGPTHYRKRRSALANPTSSKNITLASRVDIGTWDSGSSGSSGNPQDGMVDGTSHQFPIPILYLPRGFHKFSGLFTGQVDMVCGPYLAGAMKTSCRWDGSIATHCFGVAFPGNPYDDALVVIAMSQLAGSHLLNFLTTTLPMPSQHELHIQQGQ